jgi:hypothetical protein
VLQFHALLKVFKRIIKFFLYLLLLLVIVFSVLFLVLPKRERYELSEQDLRKLPLVFPISTEIEGWLMRVPVNCSGHTRPFVVDTGTTNTVFDFSYRDLLGKPIRQGELVDLVSGAKRTIDLFQVPEANLEGIALNTSGFTALTDQTSMSDYEDFDTGGLLGLDFLSGFTVQLDFDQGELRLLDPTTQSTNSWGEKYRMQYDRLERPKVSGILQDSTETSFIIDTGSVVNNLETSLFDALVRDASLPVIYISSQSESGGRVSRCVRIPKLSLGTTEYHDLLFSEANTSTLGVPFLYRHRVTIDFLRERIYLSPGAHFQEMDQCDMSGLYVRRLDGSIKVTSVIPNSPAEEVGLKVGDTIEEIDGIEAYKYTVHEIRQLLKSGDGRKIVMKVRKDIGLVDATVVLRRQL